MSSEKLPIFRKALELCVYVESIVMGFTRYHRYSIGQDMRESSKELLFTINRVGLSQNKREILTKLRDGCEDMKMLLLIAKELKPELCIRN